MSGTPVGSGMADGRGSGGGGAKATCSFVEC